MFKKIEVRLREVGQIVPFKSEEDYSIGETVIIEQDRGVDWGEVVSEPESLSGQEQDTLKRILRKASHQDKKQIEENKKSAISALNVCSKKVQEHKLPMKLVGAEYVFDRTKIIFYFTAEGRVDFRELVKDLAKIFKIRIEMRQIGVRDEAKIFGGYGVCGRPLCCKTFLKNFVPVSIRFAKEQQLPLNPQKISGICRRLMCCLAYEYQLYKEVMERMPPLGQVINTPQGKGRVVGYQPLKEVVVVQINENRTIEVKI